MNSASETIIAHVIETLPQGIDDRRKVLNALVQITPPSTAREQAQELLAHLDRHSVMQREFSLNPVEAVGTRGSGRLGDRPLVRSTSKLQRA